MRSSLSLRLEPFAGSNINSVVKDCVDIAKNLKVGLVISFNGIELNFDSSSTVEEEIKEYWIQVENRKVDND